MPPAPVAQTIKHFLIKFVFNIQLLQSLIKLNFKFTLVGMYELKIYFLFALRV